MTAKQQQMDFVLLLNVLQSQEKKAPGPTPPDLHGHPKQLYTNLSKVVCVLLVVGTILGRTERCRSELTSAGARPAEDKDTHDVAVVGFGHQQHPAHQVCGGDALRSLALPETTAGVTPTSGHKRSQEDSLCSPVPARLLHLFVGVFAVHRERYVV